MRPKPSASTQPLRLLYVGLPSFRDSFAESLLRQLMSEAQNLEIAAVTTPAPSVFESEEAFKGIEFVQKDDLEYIERIESLDKAPDFTLSQALVERHLDTEYTYLSISDRNSIGGGYPVYRRRRAFRRILSFWYGFLTSRSIDRVVLLGYPHAGWNNVLIDVAKALSIKLTLVDFTVINETTLVSELSRAYEPVAPALYANLSTDRVRDKIPPALLARAQAPLYGLAYSQKVKDEVQDNTQGDSFASLLKSAARRPLRKIRPSFTRLSGAKTRLAVATMAYKARRQVSRQLAAYRARAISQPDLSANYIYFPLHLQPERSTSPAGGFFDDQLLAAEILAASLPEGWELYIKEHPSQFWHPRAIKQSDFRSESFYERLAALPNTRLIAFEHDSHQLIEDAALIATITGTAGWETIMRGKPCLAFGEPWYRGCAACFPVDSVESCRNALTRAEGMSPKDVERSVLEFLLHYADRILPVPFLPDRKVAPAAEYLAQTKAITEAVVRELLASPGERAQHRA
ncbi:MAG TPA: hypothetical protein EYH07_19435 [Kiloniellaceae bacterium]|nr:hypothetical protein [Kiloniellaceae bacterium]HIP80620.1 hypothetical protein [Kiloniellaceae bacterium]